MVIIRTRAIEVSIQAVSPELIAGAAGAAADAKALASGAAEAAVEAAELIAEEASCANAGWVTASSVNPASPASPMRVGVLCSFISLMSPETGARGPPRRFRRCGCG